MLIWGDAAHLPLRDKSVQCIITSPPYFGLRSYNVPPQVWGGDPACPHNLPVGNAEGETYAGRKRWQHEGVSRQETPWEWSSFQRRSNDSGAGEKQATEPGSLGREVPIGYATCRLCGAARVSLGLEKLHDCLAWARGEPPCSVCYVCHMRTVARELWRVLHDQGTFWLNLGDSYASGEIGRHGRSDDYEGGFQRAKRQGKRQQRPRSAGLKPKDLVGVPWRVALALQADGWILRSDIIWAKLNPMPESVRDRPTTAHEYVFLFAKNQRYFMDMDAIREPWKVESIMRDERGYDDSFWRRTRQAAPQDGRISGIAGQKGDYSGRNKRTVWTIPTQPFAGAHFATFPEALVVPMVLAGSRRGDIVLDPFCGSGTVGKVCRELGRSFVGVDLSLVYLRDLALPRATQQSTEESIAQLPLWSGEPT